MAFAQHATKPIQRSPMSIDHFAHKAQHYEHNPRRVDNVASIASAILEEIPLSKTMHIVDFGSGTGLLLGQLAAHVGHITAIDTSPAMNAQLRGKQAQLPCFLDILEVNLEQADVALSVDGIVSSMTLHHVQNIAAMFLKFHGLLKPGGFIALADLDTEDGRFHSEDTGVFHHGFDRATLAHMASAAGFQSVQVRDASMINKPQGRYNVFLLTGHKSTKA